MTFRQLIGAMIAGMRLMTVFVLVVMMLVSAVAFAVLPVVYIYTLFGVTGAMAYSFSMCLVIAAFLGLGLEIVLAKSNVRPI
jgi:hypothetical protein